MYNETWINFVHVHVVYHVNVHHVHVVYMLPWLQHVQCVYHMLCSICTTIMLAYRFSKGYCSHSSSFNNVQFQPNCIVSMLVRKEFRL